MPLEPHPTDPDLCVYKKRNYDFGWLQTEESKEIEHKYQIMREAENRRFERLETLVWWLPLLFCILTFINAFFFIYR